MLVIATYRPGYRPPWIDRSYATHVALQPLDPDEARRVGHGQRLPGDGAAGPLRLTHGGELVAIAEPSAGELRPVVVFAAR
jgi:hypothetical protein